jgi:NAD(P)-dependent dehydrogenase (short-subunit alcohol dehydrogenase family)
MSRADDRARLVAEAEAAIGRIDILVNNAAASFYRPFLDWTDKRFAIAFEINVRAAFDLAQRIVPSMKTRGSGWILNISSKTAVPPVGPPYDDFQRHGGDLLYGMTKAAVVLCGPGASTGRVAYSLELLASLGRPIRRFDGVSILSASGR